MAWMDSIRRTAWIAVACMGGQAWAGATDGCTPVSLTAPVPEKDICYGTAKWVEDKLNGKTLYQKFDFYAAPSSQPTPLVIWAHPNGMSKALPVAGTLYKALVPQALNAGFSFASIEFRHPVTNEMEAPNNNGQVPHLDVARAIQFIRANAQAMNVDPKNIFFLGQSRGTLTLWTALQNDMADPYASDPVAQQSTRVNAVFGFNAQTTYDGREFADLFIVPADRLDFVRDFISLHPYYDQFGSAVRSVNAGVQADPPVKLRYDHKPNRRRLTYDEMKQQDAEHYPDFGLALCKAYLDAFGTAEPRCFYEANTKFDGNPVAAFAGYIDFFKTYLAAN